MNYFEQSKRSNIPYVEWIAENYAAPTQIDNNPSLPWLVDESERGRRSPFRKVRGTLRSTANSLNHALFSGSSFFEDVSGAGRNPGGFFWKLVSLSVIPVLYAMAGYFFSSLYLGWWESISRVVACLVFILVLYQATVRLNARPSFLDTLKFFVEEAGVVWVMWMVGSLSYTFLRHHWGLFSAVSTLVGLMLAGLTCLLTARRLRLRPAAAKILPYLSQVAWVAATNLAALAVGFVAASFVWKQARAPYGNYMVAMLFALLWFWIAVNLFFVDSDSTTSASRLERGSAIEIN